MYSLQWPAAGTDGVEFDAQTRVLSWTAAAVGSKTFTVRATDLQGAYGEQTFTVPAETAPPFNDAPRITSIPTGPAIVATLYQYQVVAYDPNQDELTYSVTSSPAAGGLSIGADGLLRWNTPQVVREYQIEITVSDGTFDVTQSFPLDVIASNSGPVIVSRPGGTAYRDQSPGWSYLVVATDPGADDAELQYSLREPAPDTPGVSFDPNTRLLTWTPGAADEMTFTVRVTDRPGAYAEQSFTISAQDVMPVNRPPVIRSLPPTPVRSGSLYQYPVDAYDPDGDPLVFELDEVSRARGMQISSAGLVTWTPTTVGQYDVTVKVSDAPDSGTEQFYELNVLPPLSLNSPPEIISTPPGPAVRNALYQYPARAFDPNGDAITWSLDTSAFPPEVEVFPEIEPASGLITWIPEDAGNFLLRVTADDGRQAQAVQEFMLNVLQNAPPVIHSSPQTQWQTGGLYQYPVHASDPNPGDTLSYSLLGHPAGMAIDQQGQLTWPAAAAGQYTLTVRVADQWGAAALQTYTLTVSNLASNTPPQFGADPRDTIPLGYRFLQQIDAFDAEDDPLTFSLDSGPDGMMIDDRGLVDWTPTAGDVGLKYQYTVSVTDGPPSHTINKTFALTVTHELSNAAPQFTTQPRLGLVAGEWYRYEAVAVDPDGDTITYSLAAAPAGMTIDAHTGLVQWYPTMQSVGDRPMRVVAADSLGLAAEQSVTLTVRPVNRPPKLESQPVVQAVLGQQYTYDVEASDPDGHAIGYEKGAATNVPGTIAVHPRTGVVSWVPTNIGVYTIQVNIYDELGMGIAHIYSVQVLAIAPNQPPQITSTPALVAEAGATWIYEVAALDPDEGPQPLNVLRAEPPNPESWNINQTINPVTGNLQIEWQPNEGMLLTWQNLWFQVRASDGAATASQRFQVQVQPANSAPVLAPIADRTVTAGAAFALAVSASDPNGDPLSFTLDPDSQALGMTIGSTGQIAWNPTADHVDDSPYLVTVSVSDGRAQPVSRSFQLTVTEDTTAPAVAVYAWHSWQWAEAGGGLPYWPPLDSADLGQQISILVHAIDDVAVAGRTLTLLRATADGDTTELNRPLPLDGAGWAQLTLAGDLRGTLEFRATATDTADPAHTATAETTLRVLNPYDLIPPSATLISPTDNLKISQPTAVIGSVSDDLPGVTWRLDRIAADNGHKEEIATGDGPVDGALLASFDPTLLRNGFYHLVLTAFDSNDNTVTDSVTVEVEGNLKLGNFTLSFIDLELQLVGLPITITRTYDTLEADVEGDFGYGWRLDVANTRVEVIQPGNTSGVPMPLADNDRIVFTLPDGSQHGFTFYGKPVNRNAPISEQQAWPEFRPDVGNSSTLWLTQQDPPLLRAADGYVATASNTPYNPATGAYGEYVLQLRNGTQLVIDPRQGTLQQLTDALGNTLYFSPNGIPHNSGRGVTFQRQGGRITAVIDPAGRRIEYAYSPDGDLIAVTDRSGATTTFSYLAERDHYLHEIHDPLGRPAARTEYDEDGRVKRLTDADGKTIEYQWNGDSKIQHVTDQLGYTLIVQTDARGNVIREQDPEGGITLRAYNADDNLLMETQVVGLVDSPQNGEIDDLVTTYTYDADGNRLTETDARDNVTHYTYNQHGQVTSVTGPASRSSNDYAPNGLLRSITDANNRDTRFDYDGRGNMTVVRDHDGNPLVSSTYNKYGDVTSTTSAAGRTTYSDYDTNGNQVASWYFDGPAGDRSQILDVTHYDESNRVTGTRRLVLPEGQHITADLATVDFTQPAYAEHTLWTTGTQYDLTGQVIRSTDQHGSATETTYDLRGQSIQTRTLAQATSIVTGSVSEDPQWLLSRVVQDAKGRAILTTASYLEHPDVTAANEAAFDPTTGTYTSFTFDTTTVARATYTIYDGADRVVKTLQLKDITVRIVGQAPALTTQIAVAGTIYVPAVHGTLEQFFQSRGVVISTTQTVYDNAGRVTSSFDQYGAETRTTYNRFGEVIQTATLVTRSVSEGSGTELVWLVSRTVYDSLGRAEYTTDRFELPYNEQAEPGAEGSPTADSPPVYATRTIYDGQGRVVRTQRLKDVIVTIADPIQNPQSHVQNPADPGTLISTTQTIYNTKGQVARSIAADGQVTDYEYDSLGRQAATIGHAVPADSVALPESVLSALGSPLSAFYIRLRNETLYDNQGRVGTQRTNVIVVQDANGNSLAQFPEPLYDAVQETSYRYDAFGNRIQTTYADRSFVVYHYDKYGRQDGESQQLRAGAIVEWPEASGADSFVLVHWDVDRDGTADASPPAGETWGPGDDVPTKFFEYDPQGRLAAVILPAVDHPAPSIGAVHPRYEYTYNAQGNLVGIRDNVYQLGSDIYYSHTGDANDFSDDYDTRLTWFTFDAQGRQLTRTLPLGVRDAFPGILPTQLAFPETDSQRLPFTEYFAYNDLGQQSLHVSFEGIVTAFVYDDSPGSGGRLLEKQFFDSLDDYSADPTEPAEVWAYTYDAFGRQTHVVASLRDAAANERIVHRTESNTYDPLGQLITVASPEGILHYAYDAVTGRQERTWSTPSFTGRYDFGTADSPLVDGYTRVNATAYNSSLGHGWQTGSITAHNRATGTALTRDNNVTGAGTFAVE